MVEYLKIFEHKDNKKNSKYLNLIPGGVFLNITEDNYLFIDIATYDMFHPWTITEYYLFTDTRLGALLVLRELIQNDW